MKVNLLILSVIFQGSLLLCLCSVYRQANPSRFGGWVSAMIILCYLAVDYDFAFSAGSVSMYDWYRVIHLLFLYVSSLLTLWLFYRLLVMDPGTVKG